MSDKLKTKIIIFRGMLTIILMPFVPIGGGGISLVFVLSVPILIGLGLLFALIYHALSKRIKSEQIKNLIFVIMVLMLLVLSLLYYPYDLYD